MECQLWANKDNRMELVVEGRVWAALSTESADFQPDRDVAIPYTLSRYVQMTYRSQQWWLTSPLSHTSVQIHETLLLKFIQDMDRNADGLDARLAHLFGVLLANAGLLNTADDAYTAWPTADLTYLQAEHPFSRPSIALPPLKPPMSDDIISLPDIAPEHWTDRPLSEVVTERRTLYTYADTPLTSAQLSEYLARTLKVQSYLKGQDYDSTVRPYPSAGAAYELETYLLIEACEGLAAGFYHYDPGYHTLERLPLSQALREHTLSLVQRVTNHQVDHVEVLFFFTARIGRIHWKIRPLALSYTNLGVVFQSLYLTATAMGLAPCALGGWSAAWFAEQTGISLVEEALLGQFLVGSHKFINRITQ